ncbi:nuclear transport factor 2 family protein [Bradyrhizobium sp. LHD-71]|uniref:nuclear transport factor 2 family protein n=1 Tax=Bradyrhizobium sp. LHD-71 TaxID=3072141 RepID=UPI00280C3FF0|nr:nuclear transport factor 2 family protein [Bradyrhizobium sp. LHD-71]MDQ8727782.1 nuclear transport factor 2 family protein [Bradyrhizobium sp. LHD-71]
MNTADIAKEFTAALKAGKFEEAEKFWSDDVVSIEAMEGPMKEARGRPAVHAKGEWWTANHDVHSFEASGPYVNDDQFALFFSIDVTPKATGQRTKMDEVGLYTVRDGKIVEERFLY